jgi:hypothetical protein
MDNDAKSCYDRIVCNLAMIVSQDYGVKQNMTSLQATTAFGEATHTYQHSPTTPIHGTGQGSCGSPAIWLLISSILMDCLSSLGGGMTMINVTKNNSIKEWIDGFVDDIIQQTDNNNIIQLCKQLTIDMTIWNERLEASAGKLERSKCFYYVLSWKFDNHGNGIPMTIPEQQAEQVIPIEVIAENSASAVILQKEVHQAHKTLSCYKAIDGNEQDQIKYLTNKSRQYGRKLYNKSLTRKQANMAYKTIYIPSMRYGLPACSLSCEDIDAIQNRHSTNFYRSWVTNTGHLEL